MWMPACCPTYPLDTHAWLQRREPRCADLKLRCGREHSGGSVPNLGSFIRVMNGRFPDGTGSQSFGRL